MLLFVCYVTTLLYTNEVKEVSGGVEFGMSFDKYNDLKEGDRVECYEVEEVKAHI